MLKLKTGSNIGSDTLTRDPTRPKSVTRFRLCVRGTASGIAPAKDRCRYFPL